MRIVFQFHGRSPQASGSGDAYMPAAHVAPGSATFPGFQAELMVVDTDGKGNEGDALYLEGDGESLKKALLGLLGTLDAAEQSARREWERVRLTIRQCGVCERYFQSRGDRLVQHHALTQPADLKGPGMVWPLCKGGEGQKVWINGETVEVHSVELNFENLRQLTQRPEANSVTWSRGYPGQTDGALLPGQSVRVREGMVFNVFNTGNA